MHLDDVIIIIRIIFSVFSGIIFIISDISISGKIFPASVCLVPLHSDPKLRCYSNATVRLDHWPHPVAPDRREPAHSGCGRGHGGRGLGHGGCGEVNLLIHCPNYYIVVFMASTTTSAVTTLSRSCGWGRFVVNYHIVVSMDTLSTGWGWKCFIVCDREETYFFGITSFAHRRLCGDGSIWTRARGALLQHHLWRLIELKTLL